MGKIWAAMVGALLVMGCEQTDVENGDGTVTIVVNDCEGTSSALNASDAGDDPPGVVATCDDHLPCTVDIQCTPCSAVPEPIRYIKATCTPDEELSPFCFDAATNALLYTGCTHFIADPTPPGVKNACFPVASEVDENGNAFAGVCNAFGVCVKAP